MEKKEEVPQVGTIITMGKVYQKVILFILDLLSLTYVELLARIFLSMFVLFNTTWIFEQVGVEMTKELTYAFQLIGWVFMLWIVRPYIIIIKNYLEWDREWKYKRVEEDD